MKSRAQDASRRRFIKSIAGASAYTALGLPALTFSSRSHAGLPDQSSYKAVIVLQLDGGNDAINMCVPTGDETAVGVGKGYSTYHSVRGTLAVSANPITNDLRAFLAGGNSGNSNPYYALDKSGAVSTEAAYLKGYYQTGDQFGFNAVCPELAKLYQDGQLAVTMNIGNLVEPTSKADLINQTVAEPPFLFAHNHQIRANQTGQADKLNALGWCGRLSDIWRNGYSGGINGGSALSMNISLAGNSRLFAAANKQALSIGSPDSMIMADLNASHTGAGNRRGGLYQAFMDAATGDKFHDAIAEVQRSALDISQKMTDYRGQPTSFASVTDHYGVKLFTAPTKQALGFNDELHGHLLRQLNHVAVMIERSIDLGMKRQIYTIRMGGWDQHASQTKEHARNLRELSLGMWHLRQALETMGIADQVCLLTMSDFGRTMSNNGDGTDHGWGSHALVMGAAVNGGQVLGEQPDMRLGSEDDYSDKGRLIPRLAYEQSHAAVLQWFGVEAADMATVFPNLSNFAATPGDITSAYLNLFS
ncbi:DUF1501 domain-containing protein [Vibrio sp.]|uniref:DUF1501 domain-containing protein n=1 Tax=Vibrio sp. TaxID=678 RepID=UPI003D0AA758